MTSAVARAQAEPRTAPPLPVIEAPRALATWEWDFASDRVNYSQACAELLGQAIEELGGQRSFWLERIEPADRGAAVAAQQRALATGERWTASLSLAARRCERGRARRAWLRDPARGPRAARAGHRARDSGGVRGIRAAPR